jgi:hypothetical protein
MEHYKTQRDAGKWMLLFFPLAVTLCVVVYILNGAGKGNGLGYNPWIYLAGRYIFQLYSFLYPLIVSIFCFSYCDIEYKSNGFKNLFTLPVRKRNIFMAKILYLIDNIFISILLAYCLFLLLGFLMGFIQPDWGFQDYDVRFITLIYFSKLFLGLMAVCFIQFFLSLLFKNFVIPVGFACAMTLLPILFRRWKYIDFIPYNEGSVALSGYFQETSTLLTNTEGINAAYIVMFLLLAYICFHRIWI